MANGRLCYHCRHGTSSDTAFTVDVLEREQTLRIVLGSRRRRSMRQVKLWLQDIPDIIQTSLEMMIFGICNKLFRQRKVSPMGSPISPALCGMVIASPEICWLQSYSIVRCSSDVFCFLLRYVDSRLLFMF